MKKRIYNQPETKFLLLCMKSICDESDVVPSSSDPYCEPDTGDGPAIPDWL